MSRRHFTTVFGVLLLLAMSAPAWAQRGGGRGGGGPGGPIDGGQQNPTATSPGFEDQERERRLKDDPLTARLQEEAANARWAEVSILSIEGEHDSVNVVGLDRSTRPHRVLRLDRGDTITLAINAPTPQTSLTVTAIGPLGDEKSAVKKYTIEALVDGVHASFIEVKPGKDLQLTLPDASKIRAKKPQRSTVDLPYGRHKVTLIVRDGPGEYVFASLRAWQLVQTAPSAATP